VKKVKAKPPTAYGGQAAIEGVMMRGASSYCLAVRNPQGEIETRTGLVKPPSTIAKIPILRGVVRMASSMKLGITIMKDSAEISGFEEVEGQPSKMDLWLEKKFGDNLTKIIVVLALILSLGLSVALFMVLPTLLSGLLTPLLGDNLWALGIIEGVARLCIFIIYLLLVAQMKDIKRVFQYHGAEHKAINCYEAGQQLTPENARHHNRVHPRCGTSFLLFVMLISMIFFLFVRTDELWLRVASRILFVPFVAGVSFEVIRWAGQSKSLFVKVISWPGLKLQKITTAEPDDAQLQIAITALETVIAHEKGEVYCAHLANTDAPEEKGEAIADT